MQMSTRCRQRETKRFSENMVQPFQFICVDNALGPVNGLDIAKWQNGRHEDLKRAPFSHAVGGYSNMFEQNVRFKYSASGEEANKARLFSSVTVVSNFFW